MDDADEENLPLEAPPEQPLLKGDALRKRMDAVIGDAALWNRLEIRLGDLLEEIADLDERSILSLSLGATDVKNTAATAKAMTGAELAAVDKFMKTVPGQCKGAM